MKLSMDQIKHELLISKRTGEKFSMSAVLSDVLGFNDMFVHHEILPPGRRTSAPHAHSHREEMIYVLSGSPTAYFRGEKKILMPNEFIGFMPGQENIHYIENNTDQDVYLLVMASNPEDDRVVYGDY